MAYFIGGPEHGKRVPADLQDLSIIKVSGKLPPASGLPGQGAISGWEVPLHVYRRGSYRLGVYVWDVWSDISLTERQVGELCSEFFSKVW